MQELSVASVETEMKELTNYELSEVNGGCMICALVHWLLHGFE